MKNGDGKSQKQNRNERLKLWSWTSCSSAGKTMLHESVCMGCLAAMSVSVNINLWGLNEPVRQAVGLYQIRSASHIYIPIPISIAHLFLFQYLHSVYSTSFRSCSASFSTTCPIPLYFIPFSFFYISTKAISRALNSLHPSLSSSSFVRLRQKHTQPRPLRINKFRRKRWKIIKCTNSARMYLQFEIITACTSRGSVTE